MSKVMGGEYAISANALDNMQPVLGKTISYSSGRCALYTILKSCERNCLSREILLPDYLCDSVTRAVIDAGWRYSFYHIDSSLKPDFDNVNCKTILLINYFGLIDLKETVNRLRSSFSDITIIIDKVQAYYSFDSSIGEDYSFCSLRKWFPVADGAYVNTRNGLSLAEDIEYGDNLFAEYKLKGNILKAEDENASEAFLKLLAKGEEVLDKNYICKASPSSEYLMKSVDKGFVSEKRKMNASILHEGLLKLGIPHVYNIDAVPLFIPVFVDEPEVIRQRMYAEGIFTPIHWPHISNELNGENRLYHSELSLICDHRYDEEDMMRELKVLGI